MDSKQIVSEGERAGVLKKGLRKKTGKYRQGTLWILSNFLEILFVVIIFPKGGKGVAAKLEKYDVGGFQNKVYWVCSESGSMTTKIWIKVMILLQNRTKTLRGCKNPNGEDWKKAIVLLIDNYAVHLNIEIASEYASKYGIFIRCLLKNASHLQQPIDQHVGMLLKRRIKTGLQDCLIQVNRVTSQTVKIKIDAQKWREMVARFVIEAVKELEHPKYQHVFVLAWCNFGLYLNLDGSQDGDINTLHDDKHKLSNYQKKIRTRDCINKVTIKKRSEWLYDRNWNTQNVIDGQYTIQSACNNSNIPLNQDNINLLYLKYDVQHVNEAQIVRFVDNFNQDWTNVDYSLPISDHMLTPYEVAAMKEMYIKYGDDDMLIELFTKKLHIPLRDRNNQITHIAHPKEVSDPMIINILKETQEYNTQFIQNILNEIDINWHSDEIENVLEIGSLITESDLQMLNKNEQIELTKLINKSSNNHELTKQDLQTIVGWSWLLPDGKYQPQRLDAANWARLRGGKVGESHVEYRIWHELWQKYCEQSGPLSQIDITSEILEEDMWLFLNEQLDQRKINNLQIGSNSHLRCWFLAILYFLIGEEQFMSVLYQQHNDSPGKLLLFNILQTIKIGVLTQNINLLKMVTEFVEALLQGHYCHWDEFGSIETGFRIIYRMTGSLFNEFIVEFKVWSKCNIHKRHKFKQKQYKALRLGFDHNISWNPMNGHITHYAQYLNNCEQKDCSYQTSERKYRVISPQDDSFIMFCRTGIPVNLWKQIMGGNLIYFGAEPRQIGGAIFQVNGNHFVAAYLLNKPIFSGEITKIWYKFETLHQKIEKFDTATHQDIRFIFVHPPEASCFCEQYDDFNMIQCPNCNTWVHRECVYISDDDESEYDGANCVCDESDHGI